MGGGGASVKFPPGGGRVVGPFPWVVSFLVSCSLVSLVSCVSAFLCLYFSLGSLVFGLKTISV